MSNIEQTSDREITQQERFNKYMAITSTDIDRQTEDKISDTEANERSSQCIFSSNTIFRYFVLKLLLEIPSIPSDMDNLIDLFREQFCLSEKLIHDFQENYRADQAVQFYTKSAFIFEGINKALRSFDIDHLLQYRFILKDIYDQLNVFMANEVNIRSRKVYRGQRMNFIELWSLFDSFKQHAPIIINSFLSTSLEKEVAITFLNAATIDQQLTMKNIRVLFTIHIRQEGASSDCPFADVSKISTKPEEKELLFAPNQMFIIDKLEVISENGSYIYSVEMSLFNGIQSNLNIYYDQLKTQWKKDTNNPLVHLARYMIAYNQFEQAKKILEQILKDVCDNQTKIVCYTALTTIAMSTENHDEAAIYNEKIMELKFGHQNASTPPIVIRFPPELHQLFSRFASQIRNIESQTSLNRPLHELRNNFESGELWNMIQQAPKVMFMFASEVFKQGDYQAAIICLENVLKMPTFSLHLLSDPLLKSKCCQILGDSYRHLNLNKKALEYYTQALDESNSLPPEQRIRIFSGTGKALVATDQWKTALDNYIRAAEIYQTELPNANPDDVANIEECIEQVTSHILSSNESAD